MKTLSSSTSKSPADTSSHTSKSSTASLSDSSKTPPASSSKPSDHPTRSSVELENTLLNYILIFVTCAVIGWIWEVIVGFFQHGTFINRGVLHGPWLPIYGFGALGMIILLNRFKAKPWLVFLTSLTLCGLLEYLTGWYLETFKHLKWWDYGSIFLNFDGRVCGFSLLAFGVAGLLVVYFAYPLLTKLFHHIKLRPKKIICFMLVLLFLADFIYSSDNPNTGEGITSDISELTLIDDNSAAFLQF